MQNSKKFFDILPPKEVKKYKDISLRPTQKKKKSSRTYFPLFKIFLILFLIVLISTGFIGQFILARAEIKISPHTEIVEFQQELVIRVEEEKTYEKTLSQRFEPLEKVHREIKAEGIIRVFNAFSTAQQVLVKNTRFLTPEGVLFRSIERVVIPGAKRQGREIIPSYLDIKVRADKPGQESNIGPSTFSIPGFGRGSPRYIGFYGESFAPMTGGFIGEVFQVQEKDLNYAQEELTKRLKQEGKIALLAQLEEDFILPEQGLRQEIIAFKSSVQAGEIAEYFDFEATLSSRAFVFDKQDIRTFIKDFIFEQIAEDRRIDEDNLEYNWIVKELNFEQGEIVLKVEFSAPIYYAFDKDSLKDSLKEKSPKEVRIFFQDKEEVLRVQVDLWPFWLRSIPSDPERIKIYLDL